MKKILLTILLLASVNLVFAQSQMLPCVIDFRINNGGGSCPDYILVGGAVGGGDSTLTPTGSVTLTFSGTVSPGNIPRIASVFEIGPDTLITDLIFGPGTLNGNGTVTFCYYSGPNNNNNLNGGGREFRFNVFFGTTPACTLASTLPVSLVSFTAFRNNSNVAIRWTTATETNSLGFEIQRLIGNGNWQDVVFIPSQAAGGNSSSELTYTYTDLNRTNGVTQYRLKQTDLDTKYKFSEIRAVRGEGQLGKTIVYPNPSSDGKVNIILEETLLVRQAALMDMSGRVIRQWKTISNNHIQIENLNPGMYTLRISIPETGEEAIEKIIVNKR